MKIVILTSFQPHSIYVVNRIVKEKNVVGRVLENRGMLKLDRRNKWVHWNNIRKRYGLFKAIDRYIYLKYYRKSIHRKEEKTKISALFPNGEEIAYNDTVPTIEVGNINDDKAYQFISELSPDLICVCGTSVIKPRIFNLAKHGAINIHVGITPEYRSAKPIEWALHNRDYENVGVTLHFVDRGVDTGDTIFQEKIPVNKGDNVGSIYAQCKIAGCNLMLMAISEIEEGTVKRWRKEGVGGRKYIRHEFGLSNYLRMAYNLKMKK